jgi:hypothetical protein
MIKSTILSLSMLIAVAGFAQTPAGPVSSTSPAQPAAPAQTPATSAPAAPAPQTPADDSRIIVPSETMIPIMLLTPINTKSAFVGASFYCESVYPITVANRIIIPKGTSVRGTITQVVRPGHVKGKAQIGLRFDEMVLPNGTTVQLRAVLAGFGTAGGEKYKPDEGKIEGESTKGQDAGKVATTTVTGAEMGTIIGLEKGSLGEGIGIGAGAGAAAGVIWVLASRGKDAVLPNGTSLELKLTQPLNFSSWEVQPRTPYDEGPNLTRRPFGSSQ